MSEVIFVCLLLVAVALFVWECVDFRKAKKVFEEEKKNEKDEETPH